MTSNGQEQPFRCLMCPSRKPVTDVNDDTVPGATVVLEGPVQTDPRTVVTNGNRFFELRLRK
jgi:hypothetical protein